jgi:tripartite-type tricarboxylate transporter receptor subunit TctC
MKKIILAFTVGVISLFASNLAAKDWDPVKNTIEIVVPYGPGGGTDRTARIVSDIFSVHGWKSVVVNKPGNNSIIGTNYAADAKPDGYTLFMGGDGTLDANFVFKNSAVGITYTENSFTPIIPLGKNGLILIAPKSSPVNTYEEFRTYVRRNPNRFNVGFWNLNQASTFLMWARLDGLPLPEIIVYKSSAAARADIVGGNLDFAFDSVPNTAQLYQTDKLKILAALTNDGVAEVRALNPGAVVPDLSQKYPELNVYVWRGLYAPTGTSSAIVKEINQVINQGFKKKEFIERLSSVDRFGVGGSSEQLQKTQFDVLNRFRNISKFVETMPK